jgi:hypothetical protein
MSSVSLIMWRKAIAGSLLSELRKEPGLLLLYYEQDYAKAAESIRKHDAKVALIEAAETGGHDVNYCLKLCSLIRNESKDCKLILMCPEQDEEAVAQAVNAMQNGLIDDFIFYEASIDYLSSKIIAML